MEARLSGIAGRESRAIPRPNIINASYVRACHRSLLVWPNAPTDIRPSKLTANACTNTRGMEYPYYSPSKPARCELIISRLLLSFPRFQYLAQGISSQTLRSPIWLPCPETLCRTTSRTTQSTTFIQSGKGIRPRPGCTVVYQTGASIRAPDIPWSCHTLLQSPESSSEKLNVKADKKGTKVEEFPPAGDDCLVRHLCAPYCTRSRHCRRIRRSCPVTDTHPAGTIRLTAIQHKGTKMSHCGCRHRGNARL